MEASTAPSVFTERELLKHATLPVGQREDEEYVKIHISHHSMARMKIFTAEDRQVAKDIQNALSLRNKYVQPKSDYEGLSKIQYLKGKSTEPRFNFMSEKLEIPGALDKVEIKYTNGVFVPHVNAKPVGTYVDVSDYYNDFMLIEKLSHDAKVASFSEKRLEILEERFKMHLLYNRDIETKQQKSKTHRDFYNVRKVDTHIHLAAAMDIISFKRFVEKKMDEEAETIVLKDKKTGDPLSLKKVFERLGVDAYSLNVDSLDVQADAHTFQRFDNFNSKYSPLGQTDLRNIFLGSENETGGRFLAEQALNMIEDLENKKFEFVEWRISVHGKSPKDAERVAHWIISHKVSSHHNRWMIQVPRLYQIYKKAKLVENFGQMIKNIFEPLFKNTVDPSSNPDLHRFLLQVGGFDSVDDESGYEASTSILDYQTKPDDWTRDDNPPYGYWNYYFYANLTNLNHLRKLRGLNTFSFRPHCGEAGPLDHLSSSYLVANSINHGNRLERNTVLEYLYYLHQIGMAMSPISNNKLFLKYKDHPFLKYFRRGLNVSLSTDDPLILHMTSDPLLEEYTVASEIWNLSPVDMCEIARYSILQCSYEDILKRHWIGDKYDSKTKDSNDITKTDIPVARFQYRLDTLNEELSLINFLISEAK